MHLSSNILAVEMEAFALYANANKTKKQALCLLTASDSFVNKESMTPLQRQTSFKDMVTLALETATQIIG
jgi:purine-nucleoside phosphorylase